MKLEYNDEAYWPPITRVLGAVSFTLDLGAKLMGLSVSKSYQYALLTFDWQFGTEPMINLPQATESLVIVSPQTAAPSDFEGQNHLLVSNYYGAGAFEVIAGPGGGLVYTETDPSVGGIAIVFVPRATEGDFGRPETVAEVDGLVDLGGARVEGATVIFWSEIHGDDLGDPLAKTTLRYSVDHGAGWTQPRELPTADGAIFGFQATLVGDKLLAVWMRAPGHALSRRVVVEAAYFDGAEFREVMEVHGLARIRGIAVGGRDGEATVVLATGDEVVSRHFDGASLGDAALVAEQPARALAFLYDEQGGGELWMMAEAGGLMRFRNDGGWGLPAVVDEAVYGRSLHTAQTSEGRFVAWSLNDGEERLWYAFFDHDGERVAETANISAGTRVVLSEIVIAGVHEAEGIAVEAWAARRSHDGADNIVSFLFRPHVEPETWTPEPRVPGEVEPDDEADPEAKSGGGGCGCNAGGQSNGDIVFWILLAAGILVMRDRWLAYRRQYGVGA